MIKLIYTEGEHAMKNPAQTRKHWDILLFVAMMMGSSLGLLTNGNGVFYAPMERSLGIARGAISLHTTFKSFATAFASLTIPFLTERFGFKKVLALGVILGTIGTALMSFSNNLFLIYALGVVRGLGTAFYSMVPMSMILSRWFDKNRGLATGLASGTSGIVGSISAPLLALVIDNFGWRQAFLAKGLFVFFLGLPVLLYRFELNPQDEGLLPYGYEEPKERKVIRRSQIKDISLTNFIFISLLIISFLNTFVMYMNSHFPGYGESVGLSTEIASLMLSGAMIGNLVWKTIFGLISDRFGSVKGSLTMFAATFIAFVLMIVFRNPAALIFGSFMFGGSFAISGVALPILTTHFFGPITGPNIYSKVNFLASFGGAFGVGATGLIFDYTGSYIPAFVVALVLIAINGIVLVLAQKYFVNKEKDERMNSY